MLLLRSRLVADTAMSVKCARASSSSDESSDVTVAIWDRTRKHSGIRVWDGVESASTQLKPVSLPTAIDYVSMS